VRVRPLLPAIATLVLAVMPAIASAAQAPRVGATGDAPTIAFYRVVVANTNAQHVEQQVYVHDYWIADHDSKNPADARFALVRGPTRLRGFVAVNATVVYRQVHSVPDWETWTFAAACTGGSACTSRITPVEFYVTGNGDFWGFQHHNTVACWYHAAGKSAWINSEWTTGQPWVVYGHFKPKVVHGNQVLVTSTYATGGGGVAREVDSINKVRRLFGASSILQSATRHPKLPGYSYTITTSYPKHKPKPPKIRVCS
jgi:hypothetical protein